MLKAPDGCLQFHTNISGNVKSFNYKGVGCFSNDHVCDPDNLESCEFVAGDAQSSNYDNVNLKHIRIHRATEQSGLHSLH